MGFLAVVTLIVLPYIVAGDAFTNLHITVNDNQGSCEIKDSKQINDMTELRAELEKIFLEVMNKNPGQDVEISTHISQDLPCPGDWHKASNNYCYKLFTTKANYETAKATCEENGAWLAAAGIRDSTVRSKLIEWIKKINDESTWIGLNDEDTEGNFVWADGSEYEEKNTAWITNEPNNGKNGNEDCVYLRNTHDWKLNDAECRGWYPYLCEKQI